MKSQLYQNTLLTIIAFCLIILTLSSTGIIQMPIKISVEKANTVIPIEINSVKGQPPRPYVVVPIEIVR